MEYSLSQAAKTAGKSKATVSKDIKRGKLSASRDGNRYVIDASELIRAYGLSAEQVNGSQTVPVTEAEQPERSQTDLRIRELELELEHARAMIAEKDERIADLKGLLPAPAAGRRGLFGWFK